MSRSTIFGYSVVRDEDRVVITIEGEMAGEVLARLSHRMARANISALPFPLLGSPSMGLTPAFTVKEPEADKTAEAASGELDLAEVFGQGFDRTYDEYETRLRAYADILAAQPDAVAGTAEADGAVGQATVTASGRRGDARADVTP